LIDSKSSEFSLLIEDIFDACEALKVDIQIEQTKNDPLKIQVPSLGKISFFVIVRIKTISANTLIVESF
jgi:hypothetical protein